MWRLFLLSSDHNQQEECLSGASWISWIRLKTLRINSISSTSSFLLTLGYPVLKRATAWPSCCIFFSRLFVCLFVFLDQSRLGFLVCHLDWLPTKTNLYCQLTYQSEDGEDRFIPLPRTLVWKRTEGTLPEFELDPPILFFVHISATRRAYSWRKVFSIILKIKKRSPCHPFLRQNFKHGRNQMIMWQVPISWYQRESISRRDKWLYKILRIIMKKIIILNIALLRFTISSSICRNTPMFSSTEGLRKERKLDYLPDETVQLLYGLRYFKSTMWRSQNGKNREQGYIQ